MTVAPLRVLLGVTAAGKTAVSLPLAGSLDAEIVSVDSRQVYRGMEIGSAAPTPAERARVPHHLVAEVDPSHIMSAGEYGRLMAARVEAIRLRGRTPLLVGGSGLYLRAALGGLDEGLPRDLALRDALRARAAREGAVALHQELAGFDPVTAAAIAPRDVQRITRALEIHALTGRPPSALRTRGRGARIPARIVILDRSPADLDARIRRRVARMIEDGLLEETRTLLAGGVDPSLPALRSVGFAETAEHLAGRLDRAGWEEAIARNTRRFARRQRTWFRSLDGAAWMLVPPGEVAEATAAAVRRAWEDGGDA